MLKSSCEVPDIFAVFSLPLDFLNKLHQYQISQKATQWEPH